MPITYDLPLCAAEVQFLCNLLPTDAHYPEPYNQWAMKILPDAEVSGGPEFRLKVVALRQHLKRNGLINRTPVTYPLELTVGELWLVENAISMVDLRGVISADPPVTILGLMEKIWETLIGAHSNLVDERYLPTVSTKLIGPPMTEEQRARLRDYDRMAGL